LNIVLFLWICENCGFFYGQKI